MNTTEQIHWHSVKESQPDDETTVLIFAPQEDPPVTLGFRDADTWRDSLAMDAPIRNRVEAWAEMPEGPK